MHNIGPTHIFVCVIDAFLSILIKYNKDRILIISFFTESILHQKDWLIVHATMLHFMSNIQNTCRISVKCFNMNKFGTVVILIGFIATCYIITFQDNLINVYSGKFSFNVILLPSNLLGIILAWVWICKSYELLFRFV